MHMHMDFDRFVLTRKQDPKRGEFINSHGAVVCH